MQGNFFFLRVHQMRQQPTYYGDFSEMHYLERYLCICIPHLLPEQPNINWASSPGFPHLWPLQCCSRSVLSPAGLIVPQGEPLAHALVPTPCTALPCCVGDVKDVKRWTGAAVCNPGPHSGILLGIKFQIYNALDETEGQLLFITAGLAGVSVCHVAGLLTSSTEHTARK